MAEDKKEFMQKTLASLSELQNHSWQESLRKINYIARRSGLKEYWTYSRTWEYPWLWLQLKKLKRQNIKVLDIGSERSPFPWFLATKGFDVTISDVTPKHLNVWHSASQRLGVNVNTRILDAQSLDLPTASIDIYLSVSVLEHIPNKVKTISEAARVLRPGGILIMTFDICEPEMGMTFPEWNGRAITMQEFDDLFRDTIWFERDVSDLPWNTDEIPGYLAWHRTTAAHHNYVTGAAVIRRNDRSWQAAVWKDWKRIIRGSGRNLSSFGIWYLRSALSKGRKVAHKLLKMVSEKLHNFTRPLLESLPNSPDLFSVYRTLYNHPVLERSSGGWLYKEEFYPDYLTVGGASHAIFREALQMCQGKGIDVGAGLWPLPGATPVDVWRGPGVKNAVSDFEDDSLDYVFSSHCLEHIENWQEALSEWIQKLKTGGCIFLYLPHPDCAIWHPGSPFVGDGHKWIPTPDIIKKTLLELGCEIIQSDDGPDAMQSFYICGRKQRGVYS